MAINLKNNRVACVLDLVWMYLVLIFVHCLMYRFIGLMNSDISVSIYWDYASLNVPCQLIEKHFFCSANAIFGKVGRIASEEVVLQLINTKSKPYT